MGRGEVSKDDFARTELGLHWLDILVGGLACSEAVSTGPITESPVEPTDSMAPLGADEAMGGDRLEIVERKGKRVGGTPSPTSSAERTGMT